jgi:membrane protein DedA with SNARE-associated domain
MILGSIVEWVGPIFSSWHGYLVLAALIFLDRAAFIGIVLSGELILAVGGIFAGRGQLSVALVIVIGACAGVLGEVTSYWLGRRYGVHITRRLPFANRFNKHLAGTRDYFRRNGGKTVFVGRYVSVVGTFLPFVAGMSKMEFRRFLPFDVAAVTLWASAVTLIGYTLNSQIELVDRILSQFGWALLAAVLLLVGGRIAWKRRDRIIKWAG